MPAVDLSAASADLRVGVLCEDVTVRDAMACRLRDEGFQVPLKAGFGACDDVEALARYLDVLVVNMEGATDAHFAALEAILDRGRPQVLFGEGAGAASAHAVKRVANRHVEVATTQRTRPEAASRDGGSGFEGGSPSCGNLSVWVLGASFGGPEATKRFLSVFRREVPGALALILVQHIGVGFIEMLASQLNRCTGFQVVAAEEHTVVEAGHVYVAPVQDRIRIDSHGQIHLVEDTETRTYAPSIDEAMKEVAGRYGMSSGAIVFSGMGADGAQGARAIAAAGGSVWAQSSETCAIDSMPNQARNTGVVSFSDSPEGLAAALLKRYQKTEISKRII